MDDLGPGRDMLQLRERILREGCFRAEFPVSSAGELLVGLALVARDLLPGLALGRQVQVTVEAHPVPPEEKDGA